MKHARLAFLFVLSVLPGCSCDATVAPHPCTSAIDCAPDLSCVDGRCVAGHDGGASDGASDLSVPVDLATDDAPVTPVDAGSDMMCIPVTCGPTEVCFNGIDDDCNGQIDEGCGCIPGSTARCLPGHPDPSTPRCGWGEMTCSGTGEFGSWGPCSGGGSDAGSSLYGCRRIGIMGAPGANPSSNFQAWLETQGAIVTRFDDTASAPTLHIEELRTFDLVIVDWLQRTYTSAEADTLAAWVNEGGGLFVMTGHDSGATADRQLSLLASLGPSYERRPCSAGCDADEVCDGSICVLNGPATLLPHPTTLAADGVSTLPPVSFYGGLPVTIPASMASTFVPMATIGTHVVGAAGPIGSGRALLFGDEWIEFDSEWSTMPPIPQFWLDSVAWTAPDRMVLPACP